MSLVIVFCILCKYCSLQTLQFKDEAQLKNNEREAPNAHIMIIMENSKINPPELPLQTHI